MDVRAFNAQGMVEMAPHHTPSIRQDFERGRPIEPDSLLLAPLDFARAGGLATPCLDALAAIAMRQAMDRGVYSA